MSAATNTLVIVESPAKAKTITKYLGKGYTVLASYGHIRDLPSKNDAVRPDDDFTMEWEINSRGKNQIKEIQEALKSSSALVLATDPDREGEAISWHITEILRQKKALKDKRVERIVFHEITPSAIEKALAHPRSIDNHLVDAYLARRALDYLVGFSVSPVLWRKLPGSRSAGRVQSVALRLIAEREKDIELFVSQEYWSIHVTLKTKDDKEFEAKLATLDGKKIDKFDWSSKDQAHAVLDKIKSYATYTVSSLDKKNQKRHPSPPFTTSTLQQEASRKLGFSASRTMRIAQRLYEGVKIGSQTIGLITYMRTDSVVISQSAMDAVRTMILSQFGAPYVPPAPRFFKTKAKNAQEAHEAIRPTDFTLLPDQASRYLDNDQAKLYTLIWRRAVASQMSPGEVELVRADLTSPDGFATVFATGTTLLFDGYLKLYQEGKDEEEETTGTLPLLTMGDPTTKLHDRADQHFTQPPPRYTEASLVKRLEELGIGRPSTYATIIQVLLDRDYVRLDKKRFIPEGRGRVVTAFLENYFNQYVQYSFTADLENKLDDIANGELPWKSVLKTFWQRLHTDVEDTKKLKISDVLDILTAALEPFLWPPTAPDYNPDNPRLCPGCKKGNLSLKVGRYGAFVGCSDYPDCTYIRSLGASGTDLEAARAELQGAAGDAEQWPKHLGTSPDGLEVTLRKGPYGLYVQMGDASTAAPAKQAKTPGKSGAKAKAVAKPKRASLLPGQNPATFTLEQALTLLSLPREVATDPETGHPVLAGLGRFGPYLKVDTTFYSLPKGEDILTLSPQRALEILAQKRLEPKKPPRGGGFKRTVTKTRGKKA